MTLDAAQRALVARAAADWAPGGEGTTAIAIEVAELLPKFGKVRANPNPTPNPNPNPNQVAELFPKFGRFGSTEGIAQAHLPYISPTYPLHLPYISPISPLYLPYISPISPHWTVGPEQGYRTGTFAPGRHRADTLTMATLTMGTLTMATLTMGTHTVATPFRGHTHHGHTIYSMATMQTPCPCMCTLHVARCMLHVRGVCGARPVHIPSRPPPSPPRLTRGTRCRTSRSRLARAGVGP